MLSGRGYAYGISTVNQGSGDKSGVRTQTEVVFRLQVLVTNPAVCVMAEELIHLTEGLEGVCMQTEHAVQPHQKRPPVLKRSGHVYDDSHPAHGWSQITQPPSVKELPWPLMRRLHGL